jgi:ubiquinone/menaquinone biosynthesis C-methylase UbiE
MKVNKFNIRKIKGYPFESKDKTKYEYGFEQGHPLIRPYFESNYLIRYFYWKKLYLIANLGVYNPQLTAMDIGCGPGIFLPSLSSNFKKVFAVDINIDDLAIADTICGSLNLKNVSLVHSDISALPFSQESIDIAFSVDVLEHILDISGALDRIYATLKKRGYLIVSAPTENKINCFFRKVMGYKKPSTHYYNSREIEGELTKKFKFVKKITPFNLPRLLSAVEIFLFIKT